MYSASMSMSMLGNKGIVEDIPDGITKIRIWREFTGYV